jgi:hypothetical protein
MRCVLLLLTLLIALIPTTGWAQEDSDAVKLFKEGRAAIQRGDYNLACAKFEQSNALDKRVGTLLNLALCEEKRTRLVRALETWRTASELAKRLGDEREKEAVERAAQLDPRIPRLTLALPASAPSGTTVKIEGLTLTARTLEESELGQPMLVDPGKLSVIVTTPDGGKSSQDVSIGEGEAKEVTLTLPSAGSGDPADPGVTTPDSDDGVDGLLVAGLIVGGLGVAGIAVSMGFGAKAKSKNDESNADGHCIGNECDEIGDPLRDEAIDAATISTAMFVVGGIALAAGVTLVIVSVTTEDEPATATASKFQLGVTPTGMSAKLTW